MPAGRCVLVSLLIISFGLAPLSAGAQTLLATVPTGVTPVAVAINSVTNKIFVVNQDSNNATVIDGASNGTTTVAVGYAPAALRSIR